MRECWSIGPLPSEFRGQHGVRGLHLPRGIQDGPETGRSDEEWQPARILVEKPEFGPTERQQGTTVLRELAEPENSGFGWGYNGGGTSAAAAAILADALALGDPDTCGIGYTAYPEDEVLVQLREDFCDDVLPRSATSGACAAA
ncbi:DUF6166 domain-containing protein [Streptomyces fuscichromogenes]|uniref:Uncharacterized protein n=1 Tax=Streptomyces fuscichromogenes TaxID=1324013 RepID=A0A917XPR1_9ACTN|nr:DUF6166 domain-containing protein [Streptomyces fuscichromogenes]GGN45840.1 hypothetical protein GCM10011578_098170 [Streptomyces fuscichromogenes]